MIDFDVVRSAQPCRAEERQRLLADPGFGRIFTDHMITIDWSPERGWHGAALVPYGPLSVDPAARVLHYGHEILEGTKAFRRTDGSLAAFRPRASAARLRRSARRLTLPELPEDAFVRSLELLVTTDRDWVPATPGGSLYLRPFMIETSRTLVSDSSSKAVKFLVIASPAASFFRNGTAPITVWLAEAYSRAGTGGTGEVNCGGNYAAAFAGQLDAMAAGCDQTVWLDAIAHKWVEEMGGMNVFFVYGSGPGARLVTPPLTGTLLPGITRDSLLTLAPDLGIPAEEDAVSVAQWRADAESGALTEVFACGTAAAITPVGTVKSTTAEWTIANGTPGPVTTRLREALLAIQHGTAPDPHAWIHPIC
jgi:branched-chain amino acid aminotransferase